MLKWKASDDVEWTYKRNEGDLLVYAPTKERAMETLKEHGFLYLEERNMYRSGPTLQELLERKEKA